MPLYSDSNYYYSGASSQLYSPYSSYTPGLYSTPSVSTASASGAYAPYTSTYNRAISGSYVVPLAPPRSPTYTASHTLSSRYQPKLSTITEALPLMGSSRHGGSLIPLTRIQSPKFTSYSTPSASSSTTYVPKYVPPRPILINTADIDVSLNARFRKRRELEQETKAQAAKKTNTEYSPTPSPKSSVNRPLNSTVITPPSAPSPDERTEQSPERRGARSTIKRNRPVVRLSTIRSRSKDRLPKSSTEPAHEPAVKTFNVFPELQAPEEKISWREKLAEDLAGIPSYPLKKSPGDMIRERYLIQDEAENEPAERRPIQLPRTSEQLNDQVLIELDPLHHTVRRLSIPQCPTFHDICEDISSDKIDDDLNAGELRRRASLIQETEQELINQLQHSGSGSFQVVHLERRGSHDSVASDDATRRSKPKRKSKSGSKRIRHKISAVVDVENSSTTTPTIQETDEEAAAMPPPSPQAKISYNVEAVEEHHEIQKVFKLPKKKKSVKSAAKSKNEVLPEGFVKAVPKPKTPPKKKAVGKHGNFLSTGEIFTFDQATIRDDINGYKLRQTNVENDNLEELKTAAIDISKTIQVSQTEKNLTTVETPATPKVPKSPKSPKTPTSVHPIKEEPEQPNETGPISAEDFAESSDIRSPKKVIETNTKYTKSSKSLEKSQSLSTEASNVHTNLAVKQIDINEKEAKVSPSAIKTKPKIKSSTSLDSDPSLQRKAKLLEKSQSLIVVETSQVSSPTHFKVDTLANKSENLLKTAENSSSIYADTKIDSSVNKHLKKGESSNSEANAQAKGGEIPNSTVATNRTKEPTFPITDAMTGVDTYIASPTKEKPKKLESENDGKMQTTTVATNDTFKTSVDKSDIGQPQHSSDRNVFDTTKSTPSISSAMPTQGEKTTCPGIKASTSVVSVVDSAKVKHLEKSQSINLGETQEASVVSKPSDALVQKSENAEPLKSLLAKDREKSGPTTTSLMTITPEKKVTSSAVRKTGEKTTKSASPMAKPLQKLQAGNYAESQATVATPKPIKKPLQKSESGEDFWSQIGTRETVYMSNRKKTILENQLRKREDPLESEVTEETRGAEETKTAVTSQKEKTLRESSDDLKMDSKVATIKEDQGASPKGKTKVSPTKKKLEKDTSVDNLKEKITPNREDDILKPIKDPLKVSGLQDGQSQLQSSEIIKTKIGTEPKSSATSLSTNTTSVSTNQSVTPTTATAMTVSTTTKIDVGHAAKSPEEEPSKFAKISSAEAVAATTRATTTTTATQKTTEQTTERAEKTARISNTTTPTTNEMSTVAVTEKTKDVTTSEIMLATPSVATATTTKQEAKVARKTEALGKPSPERRAMATATATTSVKTTSATPTIPTTSTSDKKLTAAKQKVVAIADGADKSSPTTKKGSPSTAINADQFMSIAAPKVASPSKKAKPAKNASSVTTTVAAAAATPTVVSTIERFEPAMPKATTTTSSTPITSTILASSSSSLSSSTTTTATTAAATTTIKPTATDVARPCQNIGDDSDTRGGNNLSKFPTVLNLAQCLQDVDAELEDYVPSSAENSDYDDDDDSSSNYSSLDGCENLSASMKKKVKQRRKREKAAEKARFDPQKKIKIDTANKCYVKDEAPRYPLVATPRPLWKREKIVYPPDSEDDSGSEDDEEEGSGEESDDSEECSTTSEEYEDDLHPSASASPAGTGGVASKDPNSAIIRMSTCSNDSGFEGGTAPSSPKKMLETSYTYSQFQKSGRFTAPATVIPRFKTYSVEDFHFLAVLGKGSFGKVLLAELRNTEYYYAVKCLKKDVVLEDDDVDSTLIERKVLALGTKHPYLCHLFCTFQTESHLFFVMEYLNGGDLMFHIQESGRFPEERARFYGAEIISGLKFLHKKGIIYRDLKLDNVLLDFDGHVRIADFGMCKLQIYLDKTADSFCGTPDYMAPEIIKGEKYNQNVDWWSFGVLLYEMLIGQSPFSGCDEDELFWSICNEIPWFPVYISGEATSILRGLLEKDHARRIGSQYSPAGDIADHIFFHPIDWNLLEKRQLSPPFKPLVKHPLDTQYFDRVFTRERVRLTPIDKEILQSIDQKQFQGFSYTNPHITLD